jgi:hypothetical protein
VTTIMRTHPKECPTICLSLRGTGLPRRRRSITFRALDAVRCPGGRMLDPDACAIAISTSARRPRWLATALTPPRRVRAELSRCLPLAPRRALAGPISFARHGDLQCETDVASAVVTRLRLRPWSFVSCA